MNLDKQSIINRLKYIYDEKHSLSNLQTPLNQLDELQKSYHRHMNNSDVELLTPDPMNDIAPTKCDKASNIENIFKKIKMIFAVLEDLLKVLILKIDDPRYKNIVDEKIKFPKTMDDLIIVVGCYSDAFSDEISLELFNIVDMSSYAEMITIANINTLMIPFTATDDINIDILNTDFLEFSTCVKSFACSVLDVNTDFETHYIIQE